MSGEEERRPSSDSPQETAPGTTGIERAISWLERKRRSKEDARVAGELRGQLARGWTEKALTRTTTGAIYFVVIVAVLFWGRVPTTALVASMAWLCCSEFFRMARMGGRMPNEVFGLTASVLFPLAALLLGTEGLFLVLVLLLVACAFWYVATPRANISDVALTAFGPVYTSLTFSCVVLIRSTDPGSSGGLLTFGVMGSVWLNDAMAYFVGTRFGRHKLAPRISPHKSFEGFWGGLASSVLVWYLLALLGVRGVTYPLALAGGLLVGTIAVVGDLFESRIKRGVGVKDSGDFMPGHGGLLDRSDSMLFGCVTAYLVLRMGGIL